MILRLTVLLLLLLNLAAAAWWLWGGRVARPVPATVAGVPTLHLLHEALPRAATRALSTPGAAAPGTPAQCLSVGPFTTQAEMHQAFAALDAHVPRIQYRVAESAVSRGWWVYLTAAGREQALATARALAAHGVRDDYVITAGDQQNSISLGLFQDPANARRREAQLRALGFPAQMRQRVEQVPQYYIEFQLPAAPGFVWQTHVAHADILNAQARACD
ncbi:MAG: SPOR domain-containing protein [Metallibacterium sp.]